jgi:hypothetical protein
VRTKRFVLIIAAAALFGVVTGYLGSAVDHYNHSRVGTMYSQWRGEWRGFPGLPGALLAERRTGYDWRADEEWIHRHSVAVWNALFWSFAALVCSAPFLLRSAPRPHASNQVA